VVRQRSGSYLVATATAAVTLVVVGIGASAQTSAREPVYPTGLADSPADRVETTDIAPLTRAYIPEAIDLADLMPTPQQQQHNSCVAWSVGYALGGYYAQARAGTRGDPDNIPSPADLHTQNSPPGQCKTTGASFFDVLTLLRDRGAHSLREVPADKTCELVQVAGQRRFRITSFSRIAYQVQRDGTVGRGHLPLNLDRLKLQLKDGHPVVFGMHVGPRMMSHAPGAVYAGGDEFSTGERSGKHAMAVVGYDDRRQAFRIMNSWGTTWGDGGFGWISYDAFKREAREVWAVRPEAAPPRPAPGRSQSAPAWIGPGEGYDCAAVEQSREESSDRGGSGALVLKGFVSTVDDLTTLAGKLASQPAIRNEVRLRPWPICEALLTLREPLRAAKRPKVELVGGDRVLKVGDAFAIQITTADVPTYLYALYIEDDGTVVNLAPRRGPIRGQTRERTTLFFGDGKEGRPTFRVAPLKSTDAHGAPLPKGHPHRGHEAVIVLTARAPIEELEDEETQRGPMFQSAATAKATNSGSPDRLLLSRLRDIVLRRAGSAQLPQGIAAALPREVSADVLHLRIEE
jgi:hypothetical protein